MDEQDEKKIQVLRDADRWRGILFAGALGDAFGHRRGGLFSDDTVLTMGVAEALLECHVSRKVWEPVGVMATMQKVFRTDPVPPAGRGYGEKTARLFSHWRPDGAYERGSWDSCGLLMKISPLAALVNPTLGDVGVAGYFSHAGHPTAVFAAWLHVKALRHVAASLQPLTWDDVAGWAHPSADPFLHASLAAARSMPFSPLFSPFQILFKQTGRNKAVVVLVLALWFAMPFLNDREGLRHLPLLFRTVREIDPHHDTDTILKLAAELAGARYGWKACREALLADHELAEFWKAFVAKEDVERLERLSVRLTGIV